MMVDHDREAFMQNLPAFVAQVDDVDHINLFLSSVGYCFFSTSRIGNVAYVFCWHFRKEIQPPEALAALCDGLRVELEKKDLHKYINSILTAYVVKSPPDHEAALTLLLRLRGQPIYILISSVLR